MSPTCPELLEPDKRAGKQIMEIIESVAISWRNRNQKYGEEVVRMYNEPVVLKTLGPQNAANLIKQVVFTSSGLKASICTHPPHPSIQVMEIDHRP